MRGYLIMILAMASLLAFGCNGDQNGASQPRLAVVDMQRLLRDCEPGKAAEKFWEGIVSDMRNGMAGISGKMEQNPKDEAVGKEFQAAYMQAQQRMQAEQQNIANVLNDAIQRSLNALREKKGYDMILDSEVARAYAPSVDVTDAAIAEVNTQKVEFKPLPVQQVEPEVGAGQNSADEGKADAGKPGDGKENDGQKQEKK